MASPVQVNPAGTLAQQALASAPEGMLIAPVWRRASAFVLDVLALSLLMHLLTGQRLLLTLADTSYVTGGPRFLASWAFSWALFMTGFWLYWKYTGRAYHRSLGQRAFRIALVHDDGTLLDEHHWGPRAWSKLRYLVPVLGWFFAARDLLRARSPGAEHRTAIDRAHHTVAAVDWSLPSETRIGLG
jgi:hypothetical protein